WPRLIGLPHSDDLARFGAKPSSMSASLSPSIPLPATRLFGRDGHITLMEERLRLDDVQLLTLVGPPGVGKTRLAEHISTYPPGQLAEEAAFVALDTIRDAELVPALIARSLGVREESGRTLIETL